MKQTSQRGDADQVTLEPTGRVDGPSSGRRPGIIVELTRHRHDPANDDSLHDAALPVDFIHYLVSRLNVGRREAALRLQRALENYQARERYPIRTLPTGKEVS